MALRTPAAATLVALSEHDFAIARNILDRLGENPQQGDHVRVGEYSLLKYEKDGFLVVYIVDGEDENRSIDVLTIEHEAAA